MMQNENVYRHEMMEKYRSAMEGMFRYIPWFEQKVGRRTVQNYSDANGPVNSIPIPVYDSTVLAFVKGMQGTGLLNRNYVYTYSRYGIRNAEDELQMIKKVELKEIDVIFAILSKYVLGGMTKGMLWSEAVENGVFFHSLIRIKELLDIWDEPLA